MSKTETAIDRNLNGYYIPSGWYEWIIYYMSRLNEAAYMQEVNAQGKVKNN